MHTLLADVIETSGGSRELIKILNRLGCVGSPDTHDRFVTYHAEQEQETNVWEILSPDVFTFASVDTIDILQTHAAVYSGQQQRSYHGTTVQLVQPNKSFQLTPSTISSSPKILGDISTSDTIQASSYSDKNSSSALYREHPRSNSPSNSPHKLGKDGPKRRRTMPAQKLNFTQSQQPMNDKGLPSISQQLSFDGFKTSESEIEEKIKLNNQILSYMLLKVSAQSNDHVLLDIRHFLPPPTSLAYEPSKIHYMKLINESADSDDTMLYVAEKLLDEFKIGDTQRWVLLAGDGKTYQHLMKIKKNYGESLSNLLLFPGDWHTLKNFQITIMKIYYSAGLRELAESAGYKGAPLASLERCGNFKRTHNFLLQVWEAMYGYILAAFINSSQQQSLIVQFTDILNHGVTVQSSPIDVLKGVQDILEKCNIYEEFNDFVKSQTKKIKIDNFGFSLHSETVLHMFHFIWL
jgi:hypothetical protein